MRSRRLFIALAAAALSSSAARAAWFNTSGIATTPGAFLELGAGARAAALGGAYTALADDGTSVYWNPASLTQGASRDALTFMHAPYLADISYDFAGYSRRFGSGAGAGAAVQYLSAGGLARTGDTGADLGSFHPRELALSAGAGYRLGPETIFEGFAAGGAVKYVDSRLVASAKTASVDAGLLTPVYGGTTRFSLVARNLIGHLGYGGGAGPLPASVIAGASARLTPRWLAAADLQLPRGNQVIAALGTEVIIFQGFDGAGPVPRRLTFSGRAGYNTRTMTDVPGGGFSFGFGVSHSAAGSFDYALAPYGALGLAHRISVTLRFGDPPPERVAAPPAEDDGGGDAAGGG